MPLDTSLSAGCAITFCLPQAMVIPYRCITKTLFQSYRTSGGVVDIQRTIYYIAGHIGCFLGFVPWTNNANERTKTAIMAVKMIEDTHEENWTALKEDKFLSVLFED